MSTEVRATRADEMDAVLDMIPVVMGAPREYFDAHYRFDPLALPEHSRIVRADGQIVAHIRLYDRWIRVGSTAVHAGCVGDVCTLPEHRKRGHCRALLQDALDYWDRRDYDLSMILSGVGVYQRVGWVTFPETRYSADIPPWRCTPSDPAYRTRRCARDDDLPQVQDIYAAYNADRPHTTVRSPEYWARHFYWTPREVEEAFYVAERDGRIAGYCRCAHGGEALTLMELCHLPDQPGAAVSLVDALARHAHKRRYQRLAAYLPADSAVLPLLRQWPAFRMEETRVMLFQLVNLPRLMHRMAAELARRAANLQPTELALKVSAHHCGLRISSGKVEVVQPTGPTIEVGEADFFRLLLGQAPPDELESCAALDDPLRRLLAALFPQAHPVYWRTDTV